MPTVGAKYELLLDLAMHLGCDYLRAIGWGQCPLQESSEFLRLQLHVLKMDKFPS